MKSLLKHLNVPRFKCIETINYPSPSPNVEPKNGMPNIMLNKLTQKEGEQWATIIVY